MFLTWISKVAHRDGRRRSRVEFGSILVLGDNISHFVVVQKLRTSRDRN